MAMKLLRAFTDHPATVGESYFGHLLAATGFGLRMLVAGVACLVHGLFPFLCVTTGSDAMRGLHAEMAARCAKAQAATAADALSGASPASRLLWAHDALPDVEPIAVG